MKSPTNRFRSGSAAMTIALQPSRSASRLEADGHVFGTRKATKRIVGEAGRPPDNFIDPKALPPLLRQDVREAFRAIAAAQKRLSVWVPAGI